jgi:amphi-Trp domain-containing protein
MPLAVVRIDMPEEVLFSTEQTQSRAEIASYLRTVADRLADGSELTLASGAEEITLDPPGRLTFEVKAERETGGGPPELSVEFELEWTEGATEEDSELRIE